MRFVPALLLLLALTGCGGSADKQKYVGQVNDRPVTYDEYVAGVRSEFETFQLSHNASPNAEQRRLLADKAWQDIVRSIVLQEQYRLQGIGVSEAEVYDSLLTYPPAFIQNSPRLQKNGRFDPALYENALRTGEPVDLDWLKKHYFTSYLPYRKLQRQVLAAIAVTPAELQAEYNAQHGHARVDVITISPAVMPEPTVSQPEIADWYAAHRDTFLIPPSCTLQWVQFPVTPSPADTMAAHTRIDSLYQRLVAGASFSSLARRYSTAESAALGGDLGFVDADSLPPFVSEELAAGNWQKYSHPFWRGNAWVIYNPIKKTRNLVKVQEIEIAPHASAATKDAVLDEVVVFRELAGEAGMKRAAREYELMLHRAENVSLGHPFIPELGRSERLISRALALDPHTLLEPMYHEPSGCYLLMEVVDNNAEGVGSLTDVSESIAARLREQKKRQAAQDAAEALVRTSNPLAKAQERGYEALQLDDYTLQTSLRGSVRPALNHDILQQAQDKWMVYVTQADVIVAARVTDFTRPDPRGIETEKPWLEDMLRRQKSEGYFEEWLRQQIDKARIKDWRPRLPINE